MTGHACRPRTRGWERHGRSRSPRAPGEVVVRYAGVEVMDVVEADVAGAEAGAPSAASGMSCRAAPRRRSSRSRRSPSRRPRTGAVRRTARSRSSRRAVRAARARAGRHASRSASTAPPMSTASATSVPITLRRMRGRAPWRRSAGRSRARPPGPSPNITSGLRDQPIAEPRRAGRARRYSPTVSVCTSPTPRRSRSPEEA